MNMDEDILGTLSKWWLGENNIFSRTWLEYTIEHLPDRQRIVLCLRCGLYSEPPYTFPQINAAGRYRNSHSIYGASITHIKWLWKNRVQLWWKHNVEEYKHVRSGPVRQRDRTT